MAITNPEAIRWNNERLRTLAEMRLALYLTEKQAMQEWYGGINLMFPNDAGEAVEDNREAAGVSRLTGADVNSMMGVVANDVSAAEQAGVLDVINKPCVRRITVS